jgi:hypothetical protein
MPAADTVKVPLEVPPLEPPTVIVTEPAEGANVESPE